jgi:hypothetical protein
MDGFAFFIKSLSESILGFFKNRRISIVMTMIVISNVIKTKAIGSKAGTFLIVPFFTAGTHMPQYKPETRPARPKITPKTVDITAIFRFAGVVFIVVNVLFDRNGH